MSYSKLFKTFGVELEYMVVDAGTFEIAPVVDTIIHDFSGNYEGDVEREPIMWSNELALHVLEIKTAQPVDSLANVGAPFQSEVQFIAEDLKKRGLRLLPGGMHPWMNPETDTRLWPHGNRDIYQAFDRIFDCRGHGWGNLQSVHLNLPFSNDEEFLKLHTAIRAILPLLPALSASSPFADGIHRGIYDYRLEVYRKNCARIASVTGLVVPEAIRSREEYEQKILNPIYDELAPLDPDGILRYEWANARGAIARFDRNTIEIRVLDIQECPAADLAVLRLIVRMIEALMSEEWCSIETLFALDTKMLSETFLDVAHNGQRTLIKDSDHLRCLGFPAEKPLAVAEISRQLAARVCESAELEDVFLGNVLENGTLSERLVKVLGAKPSRPELERVYRRLADCLESGEMFEAS